MLYRPEESARPDPGPDIFTDPDHFSYCSLKDFILSSRSLAGTLFSSGLGGGGTRAMDLGLGEAGEGQDMTLGTATANSPVIKRGSFGFVST